MTDISGLFVCATVFMPDETQIARLAEQLKSLADAPWVFDNSPETFGSRARDVCVSEGIGYLRAERNVGIAGALNWAISNSTETQAPWILYFDQDSQISDDYAQRVRECLVEAPAHAGMIGSRLVLAEEDSGPPNGDRFTPVRGVVASGALIRVSALREVGGFDEDFMLDAVDHEACLRLRTYGWSVFVDQHRSLRHAIGSGSRLALFGKLRVTRHPWWRRRAMWRNTVVMAKRYWRVAPTDCLRLLVGRFIDTLAAAFTFREGRYLVSAGQGIRTGLLANSRRVDYVEANCEDTR